MQRERVLKKNNKIKIMARHLTAYSVTEKDQ
jgi:hypothetical protein